MSHKLLTLIILLFVSKGTDLFAQLRINFPEQRAVFQRDNSNNGKINIHGFVPARTTRVDARILAVTSSQGTNTDWITIDTDVATGTFSGFVNGKGGWYVLQVRSFQNDVQNGFTQLERVGIGEVFVISGQSNAQGLSNQFFNPNGAADDRVNGYAYNKADFIEELPPNGWFKQLTRDLDIGPHGKSAWAWGTLGDRLAREQNVPIMFFNTAYEGTDIENWAKSARGEPTRFESPEFSFTFPNQTPYSFLRIVLQNHIPLYGMRAIIWMHGEADAFKSNSTDAYFRDLKFLIEKTRQDTGKNIHWMVSRTSYQQSRSYQPVIDAQNRIIRELPAITAGPETDFVNIPRFDGVHFNNVNFGSQGLTDIANAFGNVLNNTFFQNSSPVFTNTIVKPLVACGADNKVTLTYPQSYQAIFWNKTNSSPSISGTSGEYQAVIRDDIGNYHYSAIVDLSRAYPDIVPRVSSLGAETACLGDQLEYKTNSESYNVIWQDGSQNRTYISSKKENIFAVYTNSLGCKSQQSNIVASNFVEKPNPPTIISPTGALGACQGKSIKLQVSQPGNTITWSNGFVGDEVEINTPGITKITAVASTELGCFSEPSQEFEVHIVDRLPAPEIYQSGPFSIAVEPRENESVFEWYNETTLLEITGNQFPVQTDGFYKVLGRNDYPDLGITCASDVSGLFYYFKESEITGLQVYPNPVPGDVFYIASDRLVKKVNITLVDAIGRSKFTATASNVTTPQSIKIKGEQFYGKYVLKVEYDGLFKIYNMLFE